MNNQNSIPTERRGTLRPEFDLFATNSETISQCLPHFRKFSDIKNISNTILLILYRSQEFILNKYIYSIYS